MGITSRQRASEASQASFKSVSQRKEYETLNIKQLSNKTTQQVKVIQIFER